MLLACVWELHWLAFISVRFDRSAQSIIPSLSGGDETFITIPKNICLLDFLYLCFYPHILRDSVSPILHLFCTLVCYCMLRCSSVFLCSLVLLICMFLCACVIFSALVYWQCTLVCPCVPLYKFAYSWVFLQTLVWSGLLTDDMCCACMSSSLMMWNTLALCFYLVRL